MENEQTPYLMKGASRPTSQSSLLLSSSVYLNDARLRDQVALRMLGRTGRDLPSTYSLPALYQTLGELTDTEELDELFANERRINPAFDRWMSEGYISRLKRDDLTDFAPGTVGALWHGYLLDRQFEPDIITLKEPESNLQYWALRASQLHDVFEHILADAPFDILNESVSVAMRITNVHKTLSPALAGKLTIVNCILMSAQLTRTTLHYPQCMNALIERTERGLLIGRTSDPYFMLKYEDILHLTPGQAREHIGMRNVLAVGYAELSDIISEGAYSAEMAEVDVRVAARRAAG